ncbi:MAG: DUF4235 domain-containing protein [Salinisphaera sp.]|nr:DUF4235 domain-containing protein [Salinisphaera sp.]
MNRERILWLALAAGTAIGAGIIARKGTASLWRYTLDEEPPIQVDEPGTSWQRVAVWAALSGFCVAFARVIGRGVASGTWRHALGRNPPDR